MKSLIMLTVPRTGTGFFLKLLSQHFKLIGMSDVHSGKTGLVISHVNVSSLRLLKYLPNSVILTTWRDWEKVRESFTRHGDSLNLFNMHFTAWNNLVAGFNPLVVTVEPEYEGISREDRLANLGDALGIKLETDWKPVNQWRK